MRYAPIKGRIKKSVAQPSPYDLALGVGSVSSLVNELNFLKQDIIQTVDRELEKVDIKIEEADSKLAEVKELAKGDPGEDADEQKIANWVLSQIRQPKDGKNANSEEVIKEVLSRLPPVPNEGQIVKQVLKQIPTPTASLKIIKEELNLDKEALLEEIINSPKLKLKTVNVEGLDIKLKDLDRRYVHGGGDTVAAGTNITITRNSNGDKVINASGGGGSGITRSISSVSINTAAGSTAAVDYLYLVSGTTTITLPTAVGNTNMYTIKRVGTNTVTIATTGGQTIDGSASATILVQYVSLDFISDGTNWNVV